MNLTMECSGVPENPIMGDGALMDHWHCTIRSDKGQTMQLYFSQGFGHRKSGPLKNKPCRKTPCKVNPDGSFCWPSGTTTGDVRDFELAVPQPPTLADVLDCLFSDASAYDGYDDVDSFAADVGITKPTEAIRTWEAIRKNTRDLRRLLGPAFEEIRNSDDMEESVRIFLEARP